MKAVILAEKPSVARDIARVLQCNKKGDGYLEGNNYIVTWALGHLVTLATPDYYDKKYEAWKLETLPILPSHTATVVINQTRKQYNAVIKQLKRKDVKEVIIATDAGREGELVARLILKQGKIDKPYKRLWISSVTDKAIKEGFARLQDGRKYDNLYRSALARAQADWYVGINGTRALTTKYNTQLSCGRVQTPTLAMIALREEEIRNFKSQDFFGLQVLTQNIVFTWQDGKTNQTTSFNENYIETIKTKITGKSLQIKDQTTKRKQTPAPLLYDLTELQRDVNKKYGFSAKQTLNAMQGLYEKHKMLTYPRTDSRYISKDIVSTLKERIQATMVGDYRTTATKILQQPIKMQANVVNDKMVSDHHAIIPTEQKANLAALNDAERKVYDLVLRRFYAVLLPSFTYDETKISAEIAGETFSAKGKIVIASGWKDAYSKTDLDDDGEQKLPTLIKGTELAVERISRTTGHTTPPSRFTEATLLSAMEKPSNYIKGLSKEVVTTLNEAGGLGTVATRADIIDKLFNAFVIEKKEQTIYITAKGKQLLNLAPEKLRSPVLTAQWEGRLSNISQGKEKPDAFITEIKDYTKQLVKEIKNSQATFKHENITTKMCPTCSKPMLEVNGKKGKMLVCSDRECGTRKNISTITNARCPECKRKLELFGEGDKKLFVCSTCGFRERLTAFEKRRGENRKNKASKSDVQNYMRKQSKEKEQAPSAFAKAFAGLKIDEK